MWLNIPCKETMFQFVIPKECIKYVFLADRYERSVVVMIVHMSLMPKRSVMSCLYMKGSKSYDLHSSFFRSFASIKSTSIALKSEVVTLWGLSKGCAMQRITYIISTTAETNGSLTAPVIKYIWLHTWKKALKLLQWYKEKILLISCKQRRWQILNGIWVQQTL